MSSSIKVGFPAPLTGVSALEAREQMFGALTAIEEFNSSGGALGLFAELVPKDTQTNADLAETMTAELIDREKVHVVVGALQSEHQIRISRASSPRKICYNAISQSDTILYKEHRSPYTFHEGQNPHMTVGTVARFCYSHLGDRVMFFNWESEFGKHSARALKHVGDQIGIEPLHEQYHPIGTTDFRPYLKKMEDLKPDVLVLNNFGVDQALCVEQFREAGVFEWARVVIPNISVTNILKKGQDLFESCIGSVSYTWRLEERFESAKSFNEKYRRVSEGSSPTSYSAYGYVGTRVFLEAIRRAQSLESEKIAQAVLEMRFDYCKGLQFYRRIDHQSVQPVTMVEVKKKQEAETEDDFFKILSVESFLGERAFFASREVL